MGCNWKPGYDVTMTFGSVEPHVTDYEWRESVGTFETSNIVGRVYEFGTTLKRYDFRCTLVIDEDDVRNPAFNQCGTITFNDGIDSFSGTGKITNRTRSGSAQGGYSIAVEGSMTGTVSVA